MYLKINENTKFSKVEQIVNAFVSEIDCGRMENGARLPSINQFSSKNNVGRDTIEKAYNKLKKRGYIASYAGRGYFVLRKKTDELRVLLIFNKLSSFKKIIYESLVEVLGPAAKVDLQMHHYDPRVLREIIEANLGKYDYYLIMPHFFWHSEVEEYKKIIRMVPSHELILIDKDIGQLRSPHKAVFQDFKSDIYRALQSLSSSIKKYQSVTLVFPPNIHHPKEIIEGTELFCSKKQLPFRMIDRIQNEKLCRGNIYIITEEDDLAILLKYIRTSDLEIGKDIGIISFNETIFKELLDITVITTDFQQMGRTAASLILKEECVQVRNPFNVIKRGSL
ncbi:MAG: GntR family transcriptional regulator [Candidatus Dadabacteria bacterium]